MKKKKDISRNLGIDSSKYVYLLIIVFTFILYGNTIKNGYSFDDDFVTGKTAVAAQKGISSIPEIFTSRYMTGKDLTFGYRPVAKVTFAIEYQFFGLNPHISHFINILIYALTGIILFIILRILLRKYNPAFTFVIIAIFLAHPIHTEVVASLKNREELLYFLFCLMSLYFFIKYMDTQKILYFIGGLLMFCVAYFSKQSAITFAAVIPLVLYFFYDKSTAYKDFLIKNKSIIIIAASIFLCYFLCSMPEKFLPPEQVKLLSFENPLHFVGNKWVRYATGFYSLLFYLKLIIFPHPLGFYYGYNMLDLVNWANPWAILSLIIHSGILVFGILKLRKKEIAGLGIMVYLVTIFMFSNIMFANNGIIGERFLYAPSLGFSIILAFLIFKIAKVNLFLNYIPSNQKSMLVVVLIVLLLPYSAKTITRNSAWKDEVTLFRSDIDYLENSVKANDILATVLLDSVYRDMGRTKDKARYTQDIHDVVKYFNKSMSLYPANPKALNNMGSIYMNFFNNPETAVEYFKKAMAYEPKNVKVTLNLGQCYEFQKKYDEAMLYFRKTEELDSSIVQAKVGIANAYFGKGNIDSAVWINEGLSRKFPKADFPYVNIGNYYFLKKDTATAVSYWEKAFERNPSSYEKGVSLYKYFKKKGNTEKANYYQQKLQLPK
ncbi:MAG: tetratricopeptide repeat protein [Bacteroidia bacterium]|nr:tetratricopeptide repeat protein [Bacteroidia bacterium]